MSTILVTRPAGGEDPLVAELRSRGHRVIAVPTVVTRPVVVDWPDLAAFHWIVVTSAAGVAALPGVPRGPRWAAVGNSTAKALLAKGIEADVVPAVASGVAIAQALPDAAGSRVLLVRASLADHDLPAGLRARGALVEEVTAYETVEGPEDSREALTAAIADPDLAGVVFASGSAVRGFVKLGGPATLPAITIGPRTSDVARAEGFRVAAESSQPGVERLADAVARAIAIEVGRDA